MRRFWYSILLIAGLVLLLTGCALTDMRSVAGQSVPLRTPTSLPTAAATQPTVTPLVLSPPVLTPIWTPVDTKPGLPPGYVESTPASTPTVATAITPLIPTWTPVDTKPGPPPGYVEPTPAPTPTVAAALPPSEWQEITLPPPKGSEQIVPADVSVPTVSIAIPKQWGYVNHPGSYFVGPSPSPLPMVVLGPSLPFADLESIPQNMDEFAEAIVRIYPKHYGWNARAERIAVGGHEGVLLFPSQGEVCVDLFVPLGGRYDVAYRFTLMSSLCDVSGRLTETGQAILRSIQFKH